MKRNEMLFVMDLLYIKLLLFMVLTLKGCTCAALCNVCVSLGCLLSQYSSKAIATTKHIVVN